MDTIENYPKPAERIYENQRIEREFKPQNFIPLDEFERHGWMTADGVSAVDKKARFANGSVVDPLAGIITRAKSLFPANMFDVNSYYIAIDAFNDRYIVVHKRTPLGQSEWDRANR